MDIEGLVTPAWLHLLDTKGRKYKALALVAPVRDEEGIPIQLGLCEDLGLIVEDIIVVKKD